MARFQFNYYVEDYGRVAFDAKDMQEAESLFNQVCNGEIDYEDLPNYSKKWKGGDVIHDNLIQIELPLPNIPILGLKTGV